jgi:hypothetical protein
VGELLDAYLRWWREFLVAGEVGWLSAQNSLSRKNSTMDLSERGDVEGERKRRGGGMSDNKNG